MATRKITRKNTATRTILNKKGLGMTKLEIGKPYIKVGRIKYSVANKSHLKCADIYVSKNYLRHIAIGHKTELERVGISALDFIKLVANNYNQIRKGSGDSYMLVIYHKNENIHYTACISINFSLENEFWEVKTAQPRDTKDIEKRERIW